jgi:hypothetical protein
MHVARLTGSQPYIGANLMAIEFNGGDSDDAAANMSSEVFAQCKGGSEEPYSSGSYSKQLSVVLPRKISTSQISMLTKSVAQLYTLIAQQAKADQLVSRRCSMCPTNTKQSILDMDLSFTMGQR